MEYDPLATVADIEEMLGRDLDDQEIPRVESLLISASEAVREAAGQIISRATTTAVVPAPEEQRLVLPQRPVVSVEAVVFAGEPLSGWRFVGGELWRESGWGVLPNDVDVTYTHGYADVPRPVRDLVIQLTLAAGNRVEEEGMLGSMPGIRQESISNNAYAVTYGSDEPAPISVFELPERTRSWLRRSYGNGTASVVASR